MKKEVHQRGDRQQCQEETHDGPGVVFLETDGRVVAGIYNLSAVARPQWLGSLRIVEGQLLGAGVRVETYIPVHEYFYVSRTCLLGQRLREFGQEILANDARKFFRKRMRNLFMAGSFNRGSVRIVGMQAESAARLGFNVEVELVPYFRRRGFPTEDFPREDLILEIPWPGRR